MNDSELQLAIDKARIRVKEALAPYGDPEHPKVGEAREALESLVAEQVQRANLDFHRIIFASTRTGMARLGELK